MTRLVIAVAVLGAVATGRAQQPAAASAAAPKPSLWMTKAQKADLDKDGSPDLLIEDLAVWFPGQPTVFRMTPLSAGAGTSFVLKTTLNGTKGETPFVKVGDHFEATFAADAPRWIHYSVCNAAATCSDDRVVASPTTSLEIATKKIAFVPSAFAAPAPPAVGSYVWNILEPAILAPDYDALINRAGRTAPVTMTLGEDYGELKRHEWEFQNHTAFAYGILTPDRQTEVACVYITPSRTAGYDASVRLWVTTKGAEAGLQPVLEKAVREWVAAQWPFRAVEWR
jgi:hypothetical protein